MLIENNGHKLEVSANTYKTMFKRLGYKEVMAEIKKEVPETTVVKEKGTEKNKNKKGE